MADVTYESLQSKIETQKAVIRQQKTAGERDVESLRRVHPRTPPGIYFEQVKPQIKTIKGQLGKLESAEKELSEHEQLIAERKAEGYKIRETDTGDIEFYKEVYTPGERVQVGTRAVSVMVYWVNPKTGKTGRFQGRQANMADYERQLGVTGRQVTKVTTIGGGEPIYKETEGFWSTKDVVLWEAPVIEQVVQPVPTEKRIGDITVRHIGMDKDIDLGFGKRPEMEEPVTDAEVLLGRQLGLGKVETFKEIQKVQFEKYKFEVAQYEKKEIEVEKTKGELKRLMEGTPLERVAGLGIWVTTGMLSWEDPFGIPSAYYALRGEPEKAIETKARAIVGLPIGEPWSAERFGFLGRAYTGPVATVGITYGVSAGLGAGIGAFEATTIGKYPLLVSKGVKIVGGVTKPLWTLTPAKVIEIGIGGYFGYKAIEQAIPVVAKAREEDDYGPLAGYLGSLAIYGYTGIKGYKRGKVYGYGRAEEYLYLRETYTPGTKEYVRFKSALKVARELEPIKPRHIKTLDLAKDIQRLTPESAEALYGVLLAKKRVITIGGSASAYPQVSGARLPRDIDLLVSGWKHNLRFVHTKLSKYGHAFDIHGKEFGYPGQYRRFGFLYQARQKITVLGPKGKIPGVKALRASEQLFRKGITSVLKEERLRHGILPGYDFPAKGTRPVLKDIYDFVTTARSLIADAYKGRGAFIKGRAISAEKALEIFLHPEKAPSYIKGALPVKPKSYFWKRAIVTPELLPDVLLFKGEVGVGYPKVYPIGIGLGYAPSIIPTKLPGYIPSVKIEAPPYVPTYKPSDYIPGYAPTLVSPYVPTYKPSDYIPTPTIPYVPTTTPPYIPPYKPPDYVPGYTPTPQPPYVPTPTIPYVPTTTPPYQPPYVPGYIPTAVPPLPPPPKKIILDLPDTTYELFGHTRGQGYNVFVKERTHFKGKKLIKKGKMIRLSKHPLSRTDALSLGGMAVDNSAAATFEIRPVNAMAQESIIKLKPFDAFQDKFYMKENKYIEKPKHRIDTKGEVKGISALGWYSEKAEKAVAKKKRVARRPEVRVVRERDMFDTGMDDMLINMDKIFKGVFDGF